MAGNCVRKFGLQLSVTSYWFMGLNFCFLQKNVNWFKRYSFLKCTCWFILLLVKNKLISTCSSIFVEWQLFARNRAVSVSIWKEPGYSRPPLVSFSVCSWFMDSLDTVEGFNHFYIYIWLLESWRFLSNCGCCNISLYKWDHKLGRYFYRFQRTRDYHSDSENSQKELCFSSVVVRYY